MRKFSKVFLLVVASIFALTLSACGAETEEVEFQTTDTHLQWRMNEDDEWQDVVELDEIRGEEGPEGPAGSDGEDGEDGSNGADGADGEDGEDGEDGDSAYDIYVEHFPGYTDDEEQWIHDLADGSLPLTIELEYKYGTTESIDVMKGEEIDMLPEDFTWYTDDDHTTELDDDYVMEDLMLYTDEAKFETIGSALAKDHGESVVTTGVVTKLLGGDIFTIEDEDNAIAVDYDGGTSVALGDQISISGERIIQWNDRDLIGSISDLEVLSSDNTVPDAMDLDELPEEMESYQSHRINIDNMMVLDDVSGYDENDSFSIALKDLESGNEIDMRYNSGVDNADLVTYLNTLEENDIVDLSDISVDWYQGEQLAITDEDEIDTVDDPSVETINAAIDSLIKLPESTIDDLTLETSVTIAGTNYTITWSSSDDTVIDPSDGEVTRPAAGESDETVTMTADIVDDDSFDETLTYDVTVKAEIAWDETQAFDNAELPGSYSDDTYDGIVDWTYTEARDDAGYAIDGGGIMLRGYDEGDYASTLEVTLTQGLNDLSFDYRKAFTGGSDRDYEVIITNDGTSETYVLPTFGGGSGEDTTIHNFLETNLELDGEVTIEIVAVSDAQAVFNNISWTEYSE